MTSTDLETKINHKESQLRDLEYQRTTLLRDIIVLEQAKAAMKAVESNNL